MGILIVCKAGTPMIRKECVVDCSKTFVSVKEALPELTNGVKYLVNYVCEGTYFCCRNATFLGSDYNSALFSVRESEQGTFTPEY